MTDDVNAINKLEWIAELIREWDGGDPKTDSGWKSDELLDLWLFLQEMVDNAKGRT